MGYGKETCNFPGRADQPLDMWSLVSIKKHPLKERQSVPFNDLLGISAKSKHFARCLHARLERDKVLPRR